jgi:hypothetical protein
MVISFHFIAFFLCCFQVAIGIPLINAIYETDPLVGLYTLPLLIWHPMQLLMGSYLSPRLLAFVKSEQERLGIVDKEQVLEEEEAPSSAASEPKGESDEELGLVVESMKEDIEIGTEEDVTAVYGTGNGKQGQEQHSGVMVDSEVKKNEAE